MAPAELMCESAEDLRMIVGFLRDTDASEDGWLPIFVGAVAALSEARDLAASAGDTYRPSVDELIDALEGLRATAQELGELDTAGARIAAIGESITAIGNAMDALSVGLRTPCPSAGPTAGEAPTGVETPVGPDGAQRHIGGMAPTCWSIESVSSSCQYSMMRPSAIRQMSMPDTVTRLPVGGTPMSVPLWVPVPTQRVATRSPSAIWDSMVMVRSGTPARIHCSACLKPSTPDACPGSGE